MLSLLPGPISLPVYFFEQCDLYATRYVPQSNRNLEIGQILIPMLLSG